MWLLHYREICNFVNTIKMIVVAILISSRFVCVGFNPKIWVYVDNVEGEWGAFNEIMKRKDAAVQAQVGSLQMKIIQEDKVVEQKTTELLQEWEKGKVRYLVYQARPLFRMWIEWVKVISQKKGSSLID